jgi:hypothetical protein
MRTSLRVFLAAVSTILLGAVVAVAPFATPAHALNGVSTISVDNVSISEGNAGTKDITFHVTVSPAPSVPFDNISADIKPADDSARKGQDYNDFTKHVAWSAGDNAVQTVTVPGVIKGDTSAEPNERFALTIVNATSASAGQPGSVTINNDDGTIPKFVITSPAPAAEGNGNNERIVSVSISNPGNQQTTLNYATSDGSATADSAKGTPDYTAKSGQLVWGANDGNQQDLHIVVKGDTIPEPDERFFMNFGSPNNALIQDNQNPANVDLINDDGQASDIPKLTIEAIPDKTEGDTSQTTQTVTVTMSPAGQQTVTVDYATSDGTAVASAGQTKGDYETTKGTLTFPTGTTSKSFTVPINGDPVDEQDETYHVTLTNPSNATLADPATKDAKILNDDYGQITTGPGAGGGPHTRIFGATGSDLGGFMAYEPALTSGIHVARGDFFKPVQGGGFVVGSDGIDEVITAPAAFPPNSNLRSKPVVRIFAVDGTQIASFFAYDQSFPGGVYVAAGNLDGDASNGDELVVAAGPGGGPHVKVIRIKGPGDNIGVLNGFFAYDPGFSGGVRVAVGNETGDGKDEIITAPGPGGGPHVRVWAPTPDGGATPMVGFMAYGAEFTGGVSLAAAAGRIVTGPGAGGGPHVKVFNGTGVAQGGGFMAYDPSFTGGVSVALGNLDNDLAAEIITGAGPGGGPHVKVFRQDGSMPFGTGFFAYDPNFHGGVEVAVSTGAP